MNNAEYAKPYITNLVLPGNKLEHDLLEYEEPNLCSSDLPFIEK